MKLNSVFKLVVAVAGCELAGAVGALFTAPAIQSGWYTGLAKPELAPPNGVFGPVWGLLYLLMGWAMWLVWVEKRAAPRARRAAAVFFFTQLALNVLWSIIFFSLHSPGGALIEISILWLAILATIVAFAKISKPAAWLLAPYLLWVSFAAYLNYAIWTLN